MEHDSTTEQGDSGELTKNAYALDRGESVGRYIVVAPVGHGGMGQVFRAYDPELNRQIAIKILRLASGDPAQQTLGRSRLQREAQALAKLSHPNVISIYDVGSYADGVYIAMELVEGRTLRQWIREDGPSQAQILRVFVAAGRGLSVAHQAGIVHRDFKPENVIVGDGGQIKVIDFGLARAVPEASRSADRPDAQTPPSGPSSPSGAGWKVDLSQLEQSLAQRTSLDDPSLSSSKDLLSAPLTKIGAIIGTPSYMAPEQVLKGVVDGQTDQFNYCVALYEALFKVRPFKGPNIKQYTLNVIRGNLEPTPDGVKVRGWLKKTILRGLAPNPQMRYPHMDDLLSALERDPYRKVRMGGWVLLSLLVLCAIFGLSWHFRSSESPLCKGAERNLLGIWDPTAASRVQNAFRSSRRPSAPYTYQQVSSLLDGYTQSWVRMYTETCEATRLRGTQSEQLLDLRINCLDRRLSAVRALVGQFLADRSDTVVDKAVQSATNLPELETCRDNDALTCAYALPEEPSRRRRIKELYVQLDDLDAQYELGKYKEGLRAAGPLLLQIQQEVEHPPLLARSLFTQGRFQSALDLTKEANETFKQAALVAGHAKDDSLISSIWLSQVSALRKEAKFDAAVLLAHASEVAVMRAGDPAKLRATLCNNLGSVLQDMGQFEESKALYEKALHLREKEFGPNHLKVGDSLHNIAHLLQEMGRSQEALPLLLRSLAITEAKLGPEHPDVGISGYMLGVIYLDLQQFEEAERYHRRALAIYQRTLGDEHTATAYSMLAIGVILHARGKPAEALPLFQRSLSILEKVHGPDHPDLSYVLNNLGETLTAIGKFREAQVVLERALQIREKSLGPTHHRVAFTLVAMADNLRRQGEYRKALSLLKRALDIRQSNPVRDLALIGEVHLLTGRIYEDLGEYALSTRHLESALTLISSPPVAHQKELIDTQFSLARVLWASAKDRARARRLIAETKERLPKCSSCETLKRQLQEWERKLPE